MCSSTPANNRCTTRLQLPSGVVKEQNSSLGGPIGQEYDILKILPSLQPTHFMPLILEVFSYEC